MSNPEKDGFSDLAAERLKELVAWAERRAEGRVSWLQDYVDIEGGISQEQYDFILDAEKAKAGQQITTERESGLRNDRVSTAPGINALIRPDAQRLEIIQTFIPEQLESSSPSIEEVGEIDGANHYRLYLPEGVYKESQVGITIYKKGRPDGGGDVISEAIRYDEGERFQAAAHIYFDEVVRVEGDEGDLWQNPEYKPDGSPTDFLLQKRAQADRWMEIERQRTAPDL